MAQLIKLQDYISRYEVDAKRYPTQYILLKKTQWQRLKKEWETAPNLSELVEETEDIELFEEPEKTFLQKLNPFKKRRKPFDEEAAFQQFDEALNEQIKAEEPIVQEEEAFHFKPSLLYRPQQESELKRMYIDQLFGFQLNWASTTMREKSNLDAKYQRDSLLKDLLQSLPDTFFVMYEPIMLVKKAPVELGIIIITPTECYCIQKVEEEERATFSGVNTDRFWIKRIGERTKNIVNPMISLNRMEAVLKTIFEREQVTMDIRKIVLSRNGYIDYPGSAYGVDFIDRRHYEQWLEKLKKHHSPMKHMQFKSTEALLKNVQTTSFLRAEWFTQEGEN